MVALPKIDRTKLLTIGGYVAFFATVFVLSAYFTFPYERVKDVIVRRVQGQAAPGQPSPKLTIEELGPHGLTGVSLTNVVFEKPSATAGEPPARLHFDELAVSASPFALLGDRIALSVAGEVGDGELSGEYETQQDGAGPTRLDLDLDEVDLARLGLGGLLGLPLKGMASGTIDVTLSPKPEETQGKVDLKIEGTTIGDGKAKLQLPGMPGGLTVDAIDAGTLELQVAIKDGVATIERFEGKGKDLTLTGSGSIRLVQPFALSRTDVVLGFKLDDGYAKRSDRARAALDLMAANPSTKRATGADGTMRFRLTGQLGSPRAVPASGAGASRAPGRAAAARERAKAKEEPEEE